MKLFVFLWSVVSLTTVEVSGFTLQVSPPTSFLLHGTGDAPSGAPGDTVRDVSANSEPSNDTPQKKKIVIKKREKKGTEMISERKVLTDVEFYKQQEEEKAAAAAAEGGTGGADVAAVVKPMDTVQFSILSTFRANAGVIVNLKCNNKGKETEHTIIVGDGWGDNIYDQKLIEGEEAKLLVGAGDSVDGADEADSADDDETEGFDSIVEERIERAKNISKLTLHFMLEKGRNIDNTEGMIDASVFPINYFSARQVTYFHDDAEEVLRQYVRDKLVV